jgi:hypothetical protein
MNRPSAHGNEERQGRAYAHAALPQGSLFNPLEIF